MHYIQRKILSLLIHGPALNYAKLRPKGVESNHFAYHLEQLMKAELIAKRDGYYELTAKGFALADRLSHETMTVRTQPHIVTTICVTNDQGQTALFRHAFHPYRDLVGFPQGRTHYEEHVQVAAERELLEKTGLQDVRLTQRGIAYIHAKKDGQGVSKLLTHIFAGHVKDAPELSAADPKKGVPFWGKTEDPDAANMPGFTEIKELLDSAGTFFFAEIEAVV